MAGGTAAGHGSESLPGQAPIDVAIVEDVWGQAFERLAAKFHLAWMPDAWTRPEELPERVAGARALVVRNRTHVGAELMRQLPALELVARAGVGFDNIDARAAEDLGVVVTVPVGVNAASVAEYTVGAALALARRMLPLDRAVRAGAWERTPGHELGGGTWGLLGLGATGRAVARLARALGMDVIGHDPYAEPSALHPLGARLASLEDTVRAADVLSVHLPATTRTHGLVDAPLLARLKPEAILINAGRGDVVDEEALADALTAGRLLGAALDVRASEPPGPSRLHELDNVMLTPHIAGITQQSQRRITDLLADDIEAILCGESAQSALGVSQPHRDNP